MRTKVFDVPKKLIRDFAQIMDNYELDNRIQGLNDDGTIEISVEYEPEQKKAIGEIEEMLDDYYNEEEEEEEQE